MQEEGEKGDREIIWSNIADIIFVFDENYETRSSVSPQQDKHTHSHILTKMVQKTPLNCWKLVIKKLKTASGG